MTLYNRYVKSRSDAQLRDPSSENDVSSCKPEDNAEGLPIVPCGLIAWSLFNDTYNFTRNNQHLNVNKRGISWKSDREHKFGKNVFPKNFQNGSLIGGASLIPNVSVSPITHCHIFMGAFEWKDFYNFPFYFFISHFQFFFQGKDVRIILVS